MRIFKGLENLNSVIDQHVSEWRIEQGEEPEKVSLEEALRRRLTAQPSEGSGRFSADRFLESKPKKPKNEPEAVEIIKSKDERHSWLYNEVMKAVKDASKGGKTKVVAIFVPVIQNGKEFEELPVDETVTVSPIDEDLTKVEPFPVVEKVEEVFEPEPESEDFNLLPAEQAEPDPELAEAFKEIEEKLDEQILERRQQEEQEQIEEIEPEPEVPEEVVEPEDEVLMLEEESELEQEEQEVEEVEEPVELETEPEVQELEEVPEVLVMPEEEVVAEETEVSEEVPEVQEVQEEIEVPQEIEEVPEEREEPEVIEEIKEPETEEPETKEFSLPEILDDDDVFEDDTEVQEPDETVIIENPEENPDDGEVEIIQD